jgi:hypothetical protein
VTTKTAILAVRIVTDAAAGQKGLDSYGTSVQSLTKNLEKVAIPAAAVVGVLGLIGKQALDAASEAQTAAVGVTSVFGEYADQVEKYGEAAANAVGLSTSEYDKLASVLGETLKNMGTPASQLADKTNDLIKLGADLAATYGGTAADAVDALTKALRGQTKPIAKYGVVFKAADIAAREAALGLDTSTASAKANAQSIAAMSLIYDQTSDATGNFTKHIGDAAEAQQVATANWDDAKESLGKGLLPIMSALSLVAAQLAGWVANNATAFTIVAAVVGSFAGLILILVAALKAYELWQGIATAAAALFDVALDANPIGLLIIAIGLLIAVIVILIANWQTVEDVFMSVWSAIVTWFEVAVLGPFESFFAAIADAWDAVVGAFENGFNQIVNGIKWVLDWLSNLFSRTVPSWLGDLFGTHTVAASSAAPGVTSYHSPGLYSSTRLGAPTPRGASSAGAGVQVNIYGALDPHSVAKQIIGVMNHYYRAQGGISAAGKSWGLI